MIANYLLSLKMRRMKRGEVIAIASDYGLAPNKKLGQNFLIDDGITGKIIDAVSPRAVDKILEVGPGLGALTFILAEKAQSLTAVEIDSGLYRYLKDRFAEVANVTLQHSDFLKSEFPDNYDKVVSNLPYYCASEILFKAAVLFKTANLYVMLQREMAERLIALPGTKDYGALSVTLGYYYTPAILMNVPREAFYPRPDVASVFMRLERKSGTLNRDENEMFHKIVKSAFWGRRKTILTALSNSPHISIEKEVIKEGLAAAGFDEKLRGEQYNTDEYCKLAKILYNSNGKQ